MMRTDSYDNAEDVMVGVAMQENNILLEDRPDLFNSGYEVMGFKKYGYTEEHNRGTHIVDQFWIYSHS